MFDCEFCGGQFKNRSGLSGHKRMAHHSESTSETTTQVVQDHSKGTSPTTKEEVQQYLEDYLGERLERQDELLGDVLQRLDGVFSKQSEHDHGDHCEGCREHAEQLLGANPDDDQPVAHEHGDGCPGCVHEQLKGVRRTTLFVEENVPGAKEELEHAITGQKMVTIVDDRSTVNTETLDNATFGRVLLGMALEAGQRNDPEFNARLEMMMVEARRRGIWCDR